MLHDTCDTYTDRVYATDHFWKKWKTWHSCFSQLHQRFTSSWVPWCGTLTDCDHATSQFPLMGVFGLSPSLDKVVAVGCKEIFKVNNNLVP